MRVIVSVLSRVNFFIVLGVFISLLKYNLSLIIKLSRLIISSVFFFSVLFIRLSKFLAFNFFFFSSLVVINRILYSVGVFFRRFVNFSMIFKFAALLFIFCNVSSSRLVSALVSFSGA